MATDPVIIGEYATLKPRINLVMYLIPWTFYALGCGAIVTGVAGQLLDITYEGICRIFRKLRAKQHVSVIPQRGSFKLTFFHFLPD